jgi:hypothetical protein
MSIGIIGAGGLGSNVARALAKILEAIGYFPVDLGSLGVGGRLAELPFGSLASTNFIKI